MEHGFAGPSTLIEVVRIFGKSACTEGAARAKLGRPSRFSQVVDPCPHKVSTDVVVGLDKLLQLFHLDQIVRRPAKEEIVWLLDGIGPTGAENCAGLCAYESPVRVSMTIDAVKLFSAVSP